MEGSRGGRVRHLVISPMDDEQRHGQLVRRLLDLLRDLQELQAGPQAGLALAAAHWIRAGDPSLLRVLDGLVQDVPDT